MRISKRLWVLAGSLIIFSLWATSCQRLSTSKVSAPLPTVDYSKFEAINDEDYYYSKTIGEIFVINTWQTINLPSGNNSMTIFAKVPFTVHPNQDVSAFEFKNPNRPTVITGLGKGWGYLVISGNGTQSCLDSGGCGGSSLCTGEFEVSMSLIGGLYPAPTCRLDIISTESIYIPSGENWVCTVQPGDFTMRGSMPEEWFDIFGTYDKMTADFFPLTYHLPKDKVIQINKTINPINVELNYYLIRFDSLPVNMLDPDNPSFQFGPIGCTTFDLNPPDPRAFLPDELLEYFPDTPTIWDELLTPESKRNNPQP